MEVTTLASGVGGAEGPVWFEGALWFVSMDGWLWTLDVEGGRAGDAAGSARRVAPTGGGPNGMTVGPDGALYLANNGGRPPSMPVGIQRYRDGRFELVVDAVDGRPIRHANDLVVGPHGHLWFTDSGEPFDVSAAFHERGSPPEKPGLVCRVELIDGVVGAATVVDESLYMPNGLAFTPAGDRLVVADTVQHALVVFAFTDGELGPVERTVPVDGNPDGLCFVPDGGFVVATSIGGEVHRYDAAGGLVERIRFDPVGLPTNCCLGPDGRSLYVTDAGDLASLRNQPEAAPALQRIHAVLLDQFGPSEDRG